MIALGPLVLGQGSSELEEFSADRWFLEGGVGRVAAMAEKPKLEPLEAQNVWLETRMARQPESKPILRPSKAQLYRQKVEDLSKALNAQIYAAR